MKASLVELQAIRVPAGSLDEIGHLLRNIGECDVPLRRPVGADDLMGGRNYNQKMLLRLCENLAISVLRVAPETECVNCGHPFSEHDTDRTFVFGDGGFGGSGCLNDWTGESQGCDCTAFALH